MHTNRALVGGGARGAIAPPTFLDLLNKYQFLPKNSNFFISTSTPQSQNADEGPDPSQVLAINVACNHPRKNVINKIKVIMISGGNLEICSNLCILLDAHAVYVLHL